MGLYLKIGIIYKVKQFNLHYCLRFLLPGIYFENVIRPSLSSWFFRSILLDNLFCFINSSSNDHSAVYENPQ